MLRWAILGTGFISNKMIEAIAASDGSKVALIAGRNPEKLAALQSKHTIARVTTDYDAALSDPLIDAVYIGLPNHVHHTMTIKAATHGKAVLSEKSLTTTMLEADALMRAVRQHDIFFVEGFMYLAHPFMARLLEILQDGRLGKLRSVTGHYCANIWQVVNPAGKGTLYNLGCYPASLLHLVVQTMCGEDAFARRQIKALGNRNSDGNISDTAAAIRFDNGVLANLFSTDSYGTAHSFVIQGSNGTLSFRDNPWQPVPGDSTMIWQPFDGSPEEITVSDPNDAFYHQTKLVENCVTHGRKQAMRPSPRHSDSLEIMEFLTNWENAC
ncbi:Gfo/Idh/MocA family oxidoreductase [Litoreibacter sp.]|nr:Gfo/Idh/MocA family oxidoreductase [Litoreibacter sp.]